MDIIYEVTKKFEKELRKFSSNESSLINSKLHIACEALYRDPESFYKGLLRPLKLKLTHGYDSTLYVLRINKDIRVILTIDDDPLFDQAIITVLNVVRHKSLDKAFKNIAESLYQSNLLDISKDK